MQDMQDMIDRLNQSGKRLSKGHRKIAQYIVEHYDKAVFMTASRLGESVGVSESTVVRFAAAMGYEGYPQLQRSLQELVSHRLTANQRFEMATELDPSAALTTVLKSDMQNLRNTLEQVEQQVFDEVVQRLLNANAVYVMGLRSAAPLAQFMGYYLNYIFDNVHLVSSGATDVFEEIIKLRENDVLIGISFPALLHADAGGDAVREALRGAGGGDYGWPDVAAGGNCGFVADGADGYGVVCGFARRAAEPD